MKVRPGGALLCFKVESDTPGHTPYQVHLGANRGTGSCECAHFVYRLQEVADRAPHPPEPLAFCKHIKAAREYFCTEMIRKLSEHEQKAKAV